MMNKFWIVTDTTIWLRLTSNIVALVFVCSVISGCTSDQDVDSFERAKPEIPQAQLDSAAPITLQQVEPYVAHVAFAGGGWRAHAGHAAWTMSLLQRQKTLSRAFANIGAIASNSGGSWFSTMLSYSPDFVTAIEAPNAVATWAQASPDAAGWLGQQQTLFDSVPEGCKILFGDLYLACVFDHYTGSIDNATYWHNVVNDLVFYNNKMDKTLSGTRNQWAEDKTLLLASSMLTSNAVLSQVDLEKQYYQACLAPAKPVVAGNKGASCDGVSKQVDVTPVGFTSLPQNSTDKPLPFFRALKDSTGTTMINVSYTENAYSDWPTYSTTIGNPVDTDTVPVITAAAASSAAAGFAASESVTGDWEESYAGSDEALNFSVDGQAKYRLANGMAARELAAAKIVQIADGGAVDNSGVAQLVGYLQLNNKAENFNIIAFDNVTSVYNPGGGAASVGVDIANLFGEAMSNGDQVCSGSYCVTTPDLRIFDLSAIPSTKTTWQANARQPGYAIIYTKYQVTTLDNPNFGVTAGSQGTLHAFTAVWPSADTAPTNKSTDGDFTAYADMLAFIHSGLQTAGDDGKTGIAYLEEAFGVEK